jgi:hypothetical protein
LPAGFFFAFTARPRNRIWLPTIPELSIFC